MKYAARPKSSKKKTSRNYKKSYIRSTKPSKSFTKAVQSVIHKDAENKSAYHAIDTVSFNSGINSTGDMQRILPNCQVGTAENQRIGEQCRLQSLSLKGHLMLSTANNSIANSRIGVRVFIVQPRNLSGFPDVTASATWLNRLLQKGGANVGFTGIISDLYAPINTDDIITYYDKVYYCTMPYIYTATLGVPTSGYSTTTIDYLNSVKFFNIKLKVKNKLLKYDKDYSGDQPTSYSPVMLVGYTHLDGSAADVVTTQVQVSYDSVSSYEDM